MALRAVKSANTEHDNKPVSVSKDREPAAQRTKEEPKPEPKQRPPTKRLSDIELEIARKLSFSAALGKDFDILDDEEHKVQIVIRIRPLAPSQSSENPASDGDLTATERRKSVVEDNSDECFRVVSETALIAHPPKTSQSYRSTGTATSFHFSRIYPQHTAQQELFEATTKPVIEAAFAGKNGLVFAYGVTNSGKTYTITGTETQRGVLPRALQFVIEEMGRRKENEVFPVTKITASYLEIYNENVYDLLSAAPVRRRRALRLQDCDGKIQVRGMMERPIKTIKDAEELLATGQKNKQVAETNCNMDSSRSHCIFSLYFYHHVSGRTAGSSVTALRSKVSIVDLAGSERGAKSGATGLRMQEASKINGSLMNLMRCLETLRWNQQHATALHKMVPFRESKLTRIFQENLVGSKQGPVVMIVAVNPSSHEFDETLRTLKYSAMARELVPVQKNSGKKASATYYDLDGRLRKRRRTSTEGDAELVDAQMEQPPMKRERESFGRHMKREPGQNRVGGRPPLRVSRGHAARIEADNAQAPLPAAAANAIIPIMQKEIEAHRIRTAQLEKENEELRVQLSQTNAEKLQIEVAIRAELGSEMQKQLKHIKAQYQDMLRRQQSGDQSSSFSSTDSSQSSIDEERAAWNHERLALESKVSQLQEQLGECEDEIKRIQERHEKELDCVLLKRERGVDDDDDEPEEV